MLPASWRMRDAATFRHTIRRGRKHTAPAVVIHAAAASDVQIGLVVSKAVGPAVTRNRVKRRLRHTLRALAVQEIARSGSVDTWGHIVVRALPPAASATSRDLDAQLREALPRVTGRAA